MSLVIEDGTGLSNAESYSDVDYADAYFTARGITTWTGTADEKQISLREGTEYSDLRWGDYLKGELEFPDTQALLFPRTGVTDSQGRELSGVPDILKRATCEYALIALTKALLSSVIAEESGKVVIEESEETGPIKESKKYQITGSISAISSYPKADSLMSGLVKATRKQATAYV